MMNQPSKQLGLTVRPDPCRTSDLDTETAQVGRTTCSAINSRSTTSDLQAAVSGTTSDLSDLLNDLTIQKHRLNTGVAYCLKRVGTDRYQRGYDRLTRILARDYLPAIDTLRATYPSNLLTAERDTITERLERGLAMEPAPDDDDSTDRAAELFADLLARYEVLSDALDGDVFDRHLGRVERVAR